ncbi:unnamed protein product [Pleuronectes platessa]|uniref:Uncharacterized protein n=1 Tax=Pleuronectes platessa TaxID=8262 RepID=A0A9N7V1P6_PLEPL|nr:unnamed protein product [Pleuronectes platessa]
MMKQSLTVVDAIEHRCCILPNHGFLKQLRALDITLQEEKLREKRQLQDQMRRHRVINPLAWWLRAPTPLSCHSDGDETKGRREERKEERKKGGQTSACVRLSSSIYLETSRGRRRRKRDLMNVLKRI